MKLGSIFDVEKPKTTVKNHFEYDANGINFVSSGEKNNGVVDKVKENKEYQMYPPGVITVPLKGTVLHANLQQDYFYCAHQIAILSPKKEFEDVAREFFYEIEEKMDDAKAWALEFTGSDDDFVTVQDERVQRIRIKLPNLSLDSNDWGDCKINEGLKGLASIFGDLFAEYSLE